MDVPGIASLGPDPLAPEFTSEVLGELLAGRRTQIKGVLRDQKIIARHRQRVLRRGPARREDVAVQARVKPDSRGRGRAARRDRRPRCVPPSSDRRDWPRRN